MATATRKRRPKERPKSEYQWKPGMRFAVPAQIAGEELNRIAAAAGTEIEAVTPTEVVEAAAPPEAPLHPCFEWDDRKAAESYRLGTARQLIRSVYVVYDTPDGEPAEPVVRYVHVTSPEHGRCYVPSSRIITDEELRQSALGEAYKLLCGVRDRYKHLTELSEVFEAIDRLGDRFG